MTTNLISQSCYEFEEVVPHAAPMALLDGIDCWDQTSLQAHITIRSDSPFFRDEGVPAWVGMEYMAQAVAAFAGCHAREQQQPIKIGFLVGSRRYSTSHSIFPLGAKLQICVNELLQSENGLSVFECSIRGIGDYSKIDATANLNVFQPQDPEAFYRER
jgi:predicted hotdog family 3-hydroxylacyl-ACP dehydratase